MKPLNRTERFFQSSPAVHNGNSQSNGVDFVVVQKVAGTLTVGLKYHNFFENTVR